MIKTCNLLTGFSNLCDNTSITLLIVLFIIVLPSLSDDKKLPKEYDQTTVNAHQNGGVLEKWLVSGPYYCTEEMDSATCFNFDHILQLGTEKVTLVQHTSYVYVTDLNGKRIPVKPKQYNADASGLICLDPLFTENKRGVIYAFCLVEAFIDEKIRCFFGADGPTKVGINGKETQYTWNAADSCVPLSKYFDVDMKQGMNSILLKLTNHNQHCCYTFETHNIKDSIAPFKTNIQSLNIELNKQQINDTKDSILAKLRFNTPVPSGIFDGVVHIIDKKNDTLQYIPITVEEPFVITIPDSISDIVHINADVKISEDRNLNSTRHIWKGNYKKKLQKHIKRFDKIKNRITVNSKRDALTTTLIKGTYEWVKDWFVISDSLDTDEKRRQLGNIQSYGDILEGLLSGNKIDGNKAYPVLLTTDLQKEQKSSTEYVPSYWLNYKYPDDYALPRTIKESNKYPPWIYFPETVANKRKKMPLILFLHSADNRSFNINKLKDFGILSYAESVPDFPMAVVAPLCRHKTLWDYRTLKKLLDILLKTERFDETRIYITGVGMGGFTAWHMACTYPEHFAALIPVNGSGNKDKVCAIKKMPVWAFHGVKNGTVPLDESQKMITTLKECKAPQVELSIFSEYGKDICPIVYNNPELYKWVLKHKL